MNHLFCGSFVRIFINPNTKERPMFPLHIFGDTTVLPKKRERKNFVVRRVSFYSTKRVNIDDTETGRAVSHVDTGAPRGIPRPRSLSGNSTLNFLLLL